jgi:Cu-processing system ATP-binding protein
MVRPDNGDILFQERSVLKKSDYRRRIGYMSQANNFPGQMPVYLLFKMIRQLRPDVLKSDIDTELYDQFNIKGMESKKFGQLSGGMRQKVSAALALLFNPDVLILDEPTAGLDPLSNERLKNKINKLVNEKKLVLITSHILSDLDEVATELIYMIEGETKFHKSIDRLKSETQEKTVNKIIAHYLAKETDNV